MNKRKHSKGDRYGRLVITEAYVEKKGSKWLHLTQCDCGNKKLVRGASLTKGSTTSCGCYQIEVSTSHGMCGSPEYIAWCAMMTRVSNKNQPGYKNYGGRGIDVCDEWNDFENFYRDMGKKPSKDHSIDRINNDLGYYPDNCRWADRVQQANNKRISSRNSTGVAGVSYRSDLRNKYSASLQRKNKRYRLGYFASLEDAKAAIENKLIEIGESV